MADSHKNFAVSAVATAPSPATSGTSLVVTAGHGARFPATPFNVTIWPSTGSADPSNAEVVRVTNVSTDTLTIVRAQEGSSARSVVVGDRIAATITDKSLTDAEASNEVLVTQTSHGFAVGDVLYLSGSTYAKAQADSAATAEAVGIVSASVTANSFRMVSSGRVAGLSSLTAGAVYFLSASTPGALTATEPSGLGQVSKPLLVADSTTSGYFYNFRGLVISADDSDGVGARVLRVTSAQTIAHDTWTAIAFNGETWDTGALHDTSTNNSRITVPAAGKYVVTGAAIFAANANGARYIAIARNGTRQLNLPLRTGNGDTNFAREVADVLDLVAGDYVELHVYQDSTGNLDVAAGAYLSVVRVGAGSGSAAAAADGWTASGETWTYASATTFTVTGDQTVKFSKGTRIKLTQTTVKYFVVAASSHSAGTTTVTVTGGSDYSLANAAITSPYFSYQASPQGYPSTFAFTPVWTGFSADPSSIYARFAIVGRVCTYVLRADSNGTSNATTLTVTLPVAAAYGVWFPANTVNNGATSATPGMVQIGNTATADVFRDWTALAWTASGAKNARFMVVYEI